MALGTNSRLLRAPAVCLTLFDFTLKCSGHFQVKTMECGLYIPRGNSLPAQAGTAEIAGPQQGSEQLRQGSEQLIHSAAARAADGAAGDSPAPASAAALNPMGSAIHQNLADRLRAAKVPGYAGSQDSPAGASDFLHHAQQLTARSKTSSSKQKAGVAHLLKQRRFYVLYAVSGGVGAESVALKRKRTMQDSVQHLRRLASDNSAQLNQFSMPGVSPREQTAGSHIPTTCLRSDHSWL